MNTKFVSKAGQNLDEFSSALKRSTTLNRKNNNQNQQTTTNLQIPQNNLPTLQGVFIPVCLSIWGVLMFLRFPYIIGQTGYFATLILFSIGYITSTSLSLSAISTNGTVKGGGPYYLISRSLGPEFGGSIGLIFYLGTVLSGALSLLGFVETLIANFGINGGSTFKILPDDSWMQFLYSSLLLALCLTVGYVGSKLFAKASVFLALILLISTISIVSTLLFRPAFQIPELGVFFTGWKVETLILNLWPNFDQGLGFKQMFSIVFPACTGILAGASMSGDLKSPSRSIPNGTLGAVGFTYILYIIMGTLLAGSIERRTLKSDLAVMQDVAFIPALVTIGVLSTAFFSALGSLISAAKILQAIAKDNLISILNIFGHGRRKDQEPIPALVFTWFLIQLVLFCVQGIDEIAALVTMFSLLTFGVLNLACFFLRMTGSVNFRPSFHYFNWITASVGVFSCFSSMFYVHQLYASVSVFIMLGIFGWIHWLGPPKAWGDVMQSLIYHQVRKYLLRLDSRKEHVKFWRPQILLLVHSPQENYLLIKFMNDLKKGGLFVLAHILKGDFAHRIKDYKTQTPAWLRFIDIGKIKAFVELIIAKNERLGVQNLLGSGLGISPIFFYLKGGMKPNIIAMGFFDLQRYNALMKTPAVDSDDISSSFEEAQGANITISSWKREAAASSSHYSKTTPLRPWGVFNRARKGTVENENIANAIASDPLCSVLPLSGDIVAAGEIGILPESYVGVIEDTLMMNKAMALARNFEFLEQKGDELVVGSSGGKRNSIFSRVGAFAKEEYRRLSYFYTKARSSTSTDEDCPLVESTEDLRPKYMSVTTSKSKKRYIDLWPIQMTSGLPDSNYIYSFDTYTMVLQMGCILHMNSYWKANYHLRVIIFIENQEDAAEEESRVKLLLAGLRIKAEVKMVWLRGLDSRTSDSEEYDIKLTAFRKQERSAFIQQQLRFAENGFNPEDEKDSFSFDPPQFQFKGGKRNQQKFGNGKLTRKSSLMMTTKIPSTLLEQVDMMYSSSSSDDISNDDNVSVISDDDVSSFDEFPSSYYTTMSSSYPHQKRSSNLNLKASNSQHFSKLGFQVQIDEDDEVSSSSSVMMEKENAPPGSSVVSIFNLLETESQHLILNQLMKRHSSSFSTAVIFTALPAPDPGTSYSRARSLEYLKQIDILSADLPSCILVHNQSGLTVTMSL